MGKSEEWLDSSNLGFTPREYAILEKAVIQKGSTDNGCFGVKLFPRHLRWCKDRFDKDFLFEIRTKHEVGLILLERRDRIRQAISFYRARMSGVWWSTRQKNDEPRLSYDFAGICQAYFQIEQSYAFWRAYLSLSGLSFTPFFYEDLLPDPKPYLGAVAGFLDVPVPEVSPGSELRIQRDKLTEDWTTRFREEAADRGAVEALEDMSVSRTLRNLARFALKRPLTRKRF